RLPPHRCFAPMKQCPPINRVEAPRIRSGRTESQFKVKGSKSKSGPPAAAGGPDKFIPILAADSACVFLAFFVCLGGCGCLREQGRSAVHGAALRFLCRDVFSFFWASQLCFGNKLSSKTRLAARNVSTHTQAPASPTKIGAGRRRPLQRAQRAPKQKVRR